MNVTNVKVIVLKGEREYEGQYYEDRLVKPTDMYEEFRVAGQGLDDNLPHALSPGRIAVTSRFVVVETDSGLSGMFGPIALEPAMICLNMGKMLRGQDALAANKLWDILHRGSIHGRKGTPMLAISALDCALWDLRGKALGQPVYRLLGGPTRPKLPVYVSALSYSVQPERAASQAALFKKQGFAGQKWFFRHGPGSGRKGFATNLELVEAVRSAVGDDHDVMFDAWNSWDIGYTLKFVREADRFRPRWIEEPVMPDKIDQLAEITAASTIPIAGGEHEYTRWGLYEIFSKKAVDVAQPDPMWAGGITEMMNICSLASVYGVPIIPHGESLAVCVHLAAAQTPDVIPMVENLEKYNLGWQYFLKNPVRPVDGFITPDDRPGLGLEIEESKIIELSEL